MREVRGYAAPRSNVMAKTEVELSEDTLDRLHGLATERGVSVSVLAAALIERQLQDAASLSREARLERASRFIGSFRSGVPDLGLRHDDYLYGEDGA